MTKAKAKHFVHLSFLVALFSSSLPFLDYIHQDVTIASPSEIIPLSIFFALIGIALLFSYCLWLKKDSSRLFATLVLTYILTEQWGAAINILSWPRSVLGAVAGSAVIQILIYIGVGLIALGIGILENKLEKRKLAHRPLESMLKIACIIILLLNGFSLFSYTSKRSAVDAYKQPTAVDNTTHLSKANSHRDVYYFVFDRYASADSLMSNFNFDNTQYINELKEKGFSIRNNAFSNYQYTAPSVASTLRLDYHTDLSKLFTGNQPANFLPYKQLIQDSQAASLFRSAGYDVYNYGNWWDLTRRQLKAQNILPEFQATLFGKKYILTEFQSMVIDKTFLGGFLKRIPGTAAKIISVTHAGPAQIYTNQLKDVAKLAKKPADKPRFVFAHFLNAHPPYVFDNEGKPPSYNPNDSNEGVPRSEKYINQLKFANSSTQQLIDTIKASSKKEPIIIIQADEGPYPLTAVKEWQKASSQTLGLKYGILAAYNLPGSSLEEVDKLNSSVNVFRFIFNKYFNANFKYLPDCSYAYNKEQPFVFYNVTPRLHPADKACQNY